SDHKRREQLSKITETDILIGDFNSNPSSYLPYFPGFKSIDESYITYDTVNNELAKTNSKSKLSRCLDGLLFRERFPLNYYKVDQIQISDHYPVLFSLSLDEESKAFEQTTTST